MTFQARPYQVEADLRIGAAWERPPGGREPLVVHATGLGKTELGLHVAVTRFLDLGGRVLWVAHREELVNEPADRLLRHWPRHGLAAGVVKAQRDHCDASFVCASVQTLARPKRMERLLRHGAFDLVVIDEAHHSTSPQYLDVIRGVRAPHTRLLGLTATADRDDGADLGQLWEPAHHMSILDGIGGGWLVEPYTVVRPLPELDLTLVTGRRDYDDAEAAAALLKAHVVENTVAALSEVHRAQRLPRLDHERVMTARGRCGVVFTHTIEQAQLTAAALKAAGWKAAWMSGDTPREERRRLLRAARQGHIEVMCNAGVLMEGTDVPRWSFVVLARAFGSWVFYVQGVGRGLRLHPESGKGDCLLIDLVAATREHSLIGAPVFLGSACAHDWEERPEGGGVCKRDNCGAKIACFKARGPHVWGPNKRCKVCDREQCPNNPEGNGHEWGERQPDHSRMCNFCEAVLRDPLAGLVARDREPVDDSALLHLNGLHPETWAVDIGEHGTLLWAGTRSPDAWQSWWFAPGAEEPRSLTNTPVEGWYAWALAKDLVRRGRRVLDAARGREVYGGHERIEDQEAARARARELAIRAGVARAC